MKTKKHEKKLKLNKKTIARLNGVEMNAALGGDGVPCPTMTICPDSCVIFCPIETKGDDTST